MTARRFPLGLTTFFPDLEPKPKQRYGWCYACGRGTLPRHESTRLHRRRTRPRIYSKGSGDWLSRRPSVMVDPYGDNRDWEQEEREAIASGEYDRERGFV
jgi:hypothetical protein